MARTDEEPLRTPGPTKPGKRDAIWKVVDRAQSLPVDSTPAFLGPDPGPREWHYRQDGTLMLFADEKNHFALDQAAGTDKTLRGYLRAHLERLGRGDYFALLAYVERNDAHDRQLQRIRRAVRDSCHVATCVGFGPRFLHSTGQAYKGGPNSGVFLQLTCDDPNDLQVPGRRFTFGVVKAAQARGDLHVLGQRNRLVLRVHLGGDVRSGLAALSKAIERALPALGALPMSALNAARR